MAKRNEQHAPVARIAEIMPESIAEELELQPGDLLLAVNGEPVTDYIAYRFAIADEDVSIEIARGDEQGVFEIEKDADEDLGIIFESDVFDGVRACRNRCVFCFEDQMPAGMRGSLSLRDDDFRLSFLHGNFLTLTNLTDDDVRRIVHEKLSPLFVSIHATDPAIRNAMLQNTKAQDIRAQLRELGEQGIEFHGQIVLCPGWNDGAVLDQTLTDLAERYPALLTVGIVPVGLTAHRDSLPELRTVTPEDAAAVLDAVEKKQSENLSRLDTRQVFAADEFYLLANRPFPAAEAYEGFPQKENGIGLARLFLDELASLPEIALAVPCPVSPVTIATGTLAAPLLEQLAAHLRAWGIEATVVPVPSLTYGGGVSVAGLITGADLRAALAGRDLGQMLILPTASLNADGIFLDDTTPEELETAFGVPIHFCDGPDAIIETICQ